ncbi:MAG: MFS transporter, partial [Verrucomicrobia bacterium]|nr:MFS transporter [Verrucomicrobiota bacterium]
LLAAGGSFGLLVSPLLVARVEALGWPVALAASRLAAVGAVSFLAMAIFPVLPVFVIGSLLATASASAAIPLMTQVYQENYPERERGRRFSRTLMIRIGVAALFSELGGRALAADMGWYRGLLLVVAGAFAFSSHCFGKIPSRPLQGSGSTHPLRALRHARDDRLFRLTLITWMFMGMGNLMMYPLRVEYLANPKYGLALGVGEVALLVGVLPNAARLIMSPVWGWLFDHMNFFTLRLTLNLGFLVGILSFFMSESMTGLVLGAVIFGVSNAGGDVAWSLWVTKFAPPERVADYMSVHTFFTGVRGVLAPAIAFHALNTLTIAKLGWVSAGLIAVSILLLLPEIKWGRNARKASALVEESPE